LGGPVIFSVFVLVASGSLLDGFFVSIFTDAVTLSAFWLLFYKAWASFDFGKILGDEGLMGLFGLLMATPFSRASASGLPSSFWFFFGLACLLYLSMKAPRSLTI